MTDLHPPADDVRADVLEGLQAEGQKTVPCKYLYDARGSVLFDEITETKAYYPTRTEMSIFDRESASIADAVGPRAAVIELGSGASLKIRKLLDILDEPAAYVSVEISKEHLAQSAEEAAQAYPDVEVQAVCADFTRPIEMPEIEADHDSRLVFFPGSTIGNFTPEGTRAMLARIRELLISEADAAIVGADLEKDPSILREAYDDPDGVTAAFNLNLLERLNRELGADFDLASFHHEARYNDQKKRIEMHIVSDREQTVSVAGHRVRFGAGETIHTENSHKFTTAKFSALAGEAGLRLDKAWTDENDLFSVNLLRRA
ncbi:MAG: L-histidine N(alpha)-methyltransferase [Phycisphaerales bacterium]|nr:MAG: L-histidine N(alpha)-methyltransferase [Phycisphaerales bacterium]